MYPYEDVKFAVKDDDVYRNLNDRTSYLQDREDYKFVATGIDWGKICPHLQ